MRRIVCYLPSHDMRCFLAVTVLLLFHTPVLSQDVPFSDSADSVRTFGIKSIIVKFKSISELKKYDGMEVVRIDFNPDGKKSYEKYLRLFDAVVYTEGIFYTYNNGLLIEKVRVMKGPESTPTVKWTYVYTNGLLEKRFQYSKKDDEEPTLQVSYEYDNAGHMIKVTNKHLFQPQMASYLNMRYEYSYHENGRIKQIKELYDNMDYLVVESFVYNGLQLVEKKRERNGMVWKSTRYAYDNQGKVTRENNVDNLLNQEEIREFVYDSKGLLILKTEKNSGGNSKYEYSYTSDGLLKEECWFNDDGARAFSFVTSYRK